ncbi:hypothetical protein FRB97_005151 [Tulasnella sp. 331]|nr:hypothetical protein FRB97_005151 [Tulasnella sp. 331]
MFKVPKICIIFLLVPHKAWSISIGNPPPHSKRGGKGKAGLGWPNGANNNITQYYSPKLSWYYTWSPWDVPGTDLEFVPMFWGIKQVSDFQWQITSSALSDNEWTSILGMNEPEQSSESNIDAGTGALQWQVCYLNGLAKNTHLWRLTATQEYIEPLKTSNPSIRLGSPACTNAPAGKQWMYDFFGACGNNCTVDFVALQTESGKTDYHDSFNRPIWVTEWACQNYGDPSLGQCTDDQITQFLQDTQSWMDSTTFVERYAWFGAMENMQGVNQGDALMSPQGTITSLGEQYIGSSASSASSGGGVALKLQQMVLMVVAPFIIMWCI